MIQYEAEVKGHEEDISYKSGQEMGSLSLKNIGSNHNRVRMDDEKLWWRTLLISTKTIIVQKLFSLKGFDIFSFILKATMCELFNPFNEMCVCEIV